MRLNRNNVVREYRVSYAYYVERQGIMIWNKGNGHYYNQLRDCIDWVHSEVKDSSSLEGDRDTCFIITAFRPMEKDILKVFVSDDGMIVSELLI